ncbi:SprB repeat-containing protein [Porifericola rhodea]|uniref:SprB repeat-containing protein n=1 Tax=Porifericola rhodea TaxID=930972 RepID=UPI002665A1C8|nr:SprB repeat-containing protein [Porifericola rhodea]WKN29566.1 SprB repeat-containing protein [Porifericola rhodea]
MKVLHYPLFLCFSLLLLACEEDSERMDCQGDFTIRADEINPASCEAANGSIKIEPSNADGNVSYRLDKGTSQNDNTFTNLAPGTYLLEAEDAAGCTASISVTIDHTEEDLITEVITTSSACGESVGSITVNTSGGSAPYTYSLEGENFQSDNTFAELQAGTYTLNVQDANGCTTEASAHIESGISFSARIGDIISTNCAVSGCHVAGTGRVNFSVKENIIDNASGVRSRTGGRSMPPANSGRSLTDEQIQAIACWVNDGAPDN